VLRSASERSLGQLVGELLLIVDVRPVALEEVLVAGRRVELDEPTIVLVVRQRLGEPLREEGLPCPWRAVEDQLPLVAQELLGTGT
jgi:hypothetical protein